MTSERARPECDVRSRNALAAGTEQGSGRLKDNPPLDVPIQIPQNTQSEYHLRSVPKPTNKHGGGAMGYGIPIPNPNEIGAKLKIFAFEHHPVRSG